MGDQDPEERMTCDSSPVKKENEACELRLEVPSNEMRKEIGMLNIYLIYRRR